MRRGVACLSQSEGARAGPTSRKEGARGGRRTRARLLWLGRSGEPAPAPPTLAAARPPTLAARTPRQRNRFDCGRGTAFSS